MQKLLSIAVVTKHYYLLYSFLYLWTISLYLLHLRVIEELTGTFNTSISNEFVTQTSIFVVSTVADNLFSSVEVHVP